MEAAMTLIPSEVLAETHLDQTKRATPSRKTGAFFRGLTAATVAMSVMLASAAPSYADKKGDDLAKALAAALILGAIVNGIDNNKPKPAPEPVRQKRVPSVCAIEIDSDHGRSVTVYTESCLRDEGFRRLPDCGRSVRIYGQRDRIYSAQCLRDAGYRTGRNH
jgi:hypothetical protein